VIGSVVLRRP